jgi:hypothetical protein
MSRLEPVMGTEIVDDIRLGHTWHEYEVLYKFLTSQNHQWFVEIGVHEGGLSYLLIPEMSQMNYLGVELDCGIVRPEVKARYEEHSHAELLCANCFGTNVEIKVSTLSRKIIYCDGGNKVKELQHFKHFCRPGDIIMAHDYHDGNRVIKGVDEVHPEVLPMDVIHLDVSDDFTRIDESVFKETRIVAWRKHE